jgi:hypothetical protein
MENTQDTQVPATTEAPAKRKYVRRTPEERIAALEAQKARILADAKVSPDVRTARNAAKSLENAAEKVTDASIGEMLRAFADDIRTELDAYSANG